MVNLEEVREQEAGPFQYQKQLGQSKKSLAIIGLIIPERLQAERERIVRVALEEIEEEQAQNQST
jgi:hypothetical protein